MMLLQAQNMPKHSANVGRTRRDTSTTHNIETTGILPSISHCFISRANKQNEWIIDSGATYHMCGPHIQLSNIRALPHPITVHMPNSSIVTVHEFGTFTLNENLTLYPVLKILNFNVNLISVTKLTKSINCSFNILS